MRHSIGIDFSKDKLDICWLRDVQANKKKTKVFRNQRKEFGAIADWIRKNTKAEPQEVLITAEPTGVYHEACIYFLHEQGFNIYLANPGKAKQFTQAIGLVHKTDKSDAYALARYGADKSDLELWLPEAPEVRELKALMRRLDALEKDYQREVNRLEASETSDVSERVLQSLHDMVAVIESEIRKLKADIDDHIDRHPHLKKNRQLLASVKGVGEVVSRELTYLFAAKSFKHAKQVACYAGLIPKLQDSGKQRGRSSLSKEGPSRIRAKLYMAAIVATQHNPAVHRQYHRLLSAGKTKMQALGAAMRKLLQICFGVVKNQREYTPQAT